MNAASYRMLRDPVRRVVLALLVALTVVVPIARAEPVQAGSVHAEPVQAGSAPARTAPQLSESPALASLVACLADRKVGDLVLLVDTSGSLGGANATDPTAVRVAAAQALVTRLAASFAQINAQVDISVAGFDDDVTQVVDFTPLTIAGAANLSGQLQSFATRDKGAETDYWSALTWLNRTFQAKAQARGNELGGSCQFALWFTDGAFTISARDGQGQDGLDPLTSPTKDIPGFENVPLTTEALADDAKQAAAAELCRVGGPVDQMRAAGITLIGVGLGRGGTADPEFEFMRNYLENASGTCGGQPSHGVFVPAASVGDLFLALDKVGELGGSNVNPPPAPVCQVQPCPEGAYSFTLDNTLSKVHLAAVVKDSGSLIRSGIQVEITPPGSIQPMVIDGNGPDAGNLTTPSAAVAYKWYAGNPLTIDLTRTQDWSGEWKVTFVDTTRQHPDAVSNINLSLTSDFAVAPVLPTGTPWRAGEDSGPIDFHPQTVGGVDVPVAEIPPGFTATATLTMPGQDGDVVNIDVSLTGTRTIAIPETTTPGLAVIRVDLNGQVAGQPLGVVSRQVAVQILPPFGAPSVAPNQFVDFGKIEGTEPATAMLSVTGPAEGDGCVTVATGTLIGTPPKVESVTITGPAGSDCILVPAGQQVPVQLTLVPGQEGNGHLEGDLTVGLAPAGDPGRVSAVPVRYQAEMQRLPQGGIKVGILIGAMLLGLLLALALIWLARRWSARFPTGERVALQSVVLDVRIGSDGLTMADGGPVALPSTGWLPVPPPGSGRRTLMVSGVALRARAGWRLTEPGYAEPESFGGGDTVGACGVAPHSDAQGRPRLPLSIQGTWTVLLPQALAISPLDEVPGRLLLVVDTAADDTVRQQLVAGAQRDAPAAVDEARERARAATKTVEPEPPALVSAHAPQYPAFGQADRASQAGPSSPGWDQPTGQPDTGWGQQPPGGGQSSFGWDPPPATPPPPGQGPTQPGGWGSAPPGGAGPQAPGRPRGSDGW